MNDLQLLEAIKFSVKLWEAGDKEASKELLNIIVSIIVIQETIKTMPFSTEELISQYIITGVNN